MAYSDYSSHWEYKDLITYQDLNQLGENDKTHVHDGVSTAGIDSDVDMKLATTKKFYLDGGGDTYIAETAADTVSIYAGGTAIITTDAARTDFAENASIAATKLLYFDGGGDTYMTESGSDDLKVYVGGSLLFQFYEAGTNYNFSYATLAPNNAASQNLGDASLYWADVSYKTLTDRGCLGWFDDGVELQDGTIVSDTKALQAIKKHPTKKTVYGVPMMDYKTFPKVSYKKANVNGKDLDRDENDEPINGADGIEMTSMFSIMIGAIKELTNRVKILEEK